MTVFFLCQRAFLVKRAREYFIWISSSLKLHHSQPTLLYFRGCTEVSFKEWRKWTKSWSTGNVQLVRNKMYYHCLSKENNKDKAIYKAVLWPLGSRYLNECVHLAWFIWIFLWTVLNVIEGSDWKDETLVEWMSPALFMCDDASSLQMMCNTSVWYLLLINGSLVEWKLLIISLRLSLYLF